MDINSAADVFNFITGAMFILIMLVYGLATFWNTKFLIITNWQKVYSLSRLLITISCAGFFLVYTYLTIDYFTVRAVDISLFSGLVIRPFMLLLGSSLAASARARIMSFKHGGLAWTLKTKRKS